MSTQTVCVAVAMRGLPLRASRTEAEVNDKPRARVRVISARGEPESLQEMSLPLVCYTIEARRCVGAPSDVLSILRVLAQRALFRLLPGIRKVLRGDDIRL